MDKTPKYILQCEKAEEIQGEWKPQKGDFVWVEYWDCNEGNIFIMFESGGCLYFDSGISYGRSTDYHEEGYFVELSEARKKIWLPTQSDLQGMVGEETWIETQVAFYDFIFMLGSKACPKCFREKAMAGGFADGEDIYEKSIKTIFKLFKSFEQAWLAFVMWELYQKKWDKNKKNWIKE